MIRLCTGHCRGRSLLWLFLLTITTRAVHGEPHPHRGVVKPFKSGDPNVKLSTAAYKTLKRGQPYQTQIQDGSAGRGLVVQDVRAPTKIVWGTILNFDAYHKMVPKTVESKTYKTVKEKHNRQRIWVRMKVGFPFLKLQFYINHLYDPDQNSLTWTLDYDVKSDLDDSAGYWYVIPHPDNSKWSRVYYSVEVSMFAWVPQFVVDFMSKQALVDATAWVKKHSELQAAQQPDEEAMQVVGDDSVRPKNPVAKLFGGLKGLGRKRATKEEEEEDELPSLVAVDDASSGTAVASQRRIGVVRYFLVATVLSLTLYNIHLYFSQ